jgi:hypothetical protein
MSCLFGCLGRRGSFLRLVAAGGWMICVCLVGVSSAHASFGLSSFEFSANEAPVLGSNPGMVGPPAVQAGSHPWSITTALAFNATTENAGGEIVPDGDVKDVEVDLPPGLVGNPTVIPKCSIQLFTAINPNSFGADCPGNSQVGVVEVYTLPVSRGVRLHLGLYNLTPPAGVPAEFGFNALAFAPVVLTPAVRTGGDYGVTVDAKNTSQALRIYKTKVTVWGVPADPSHDAMRGECLSLFGVSSGKTCPSEMSPEPFLTLPTSCGEGPLEARVRADAWQNPGVIVEEKAVDQDGLNHPVGLTGCDRLDFSPSLAVKPDTTAADSPLGVEVDLRLPQNESPGGLAEADLRRAVVALPPGVSVSPSAADGLEACTEAQIALRSAAPAQCPAASKVGTVTVSTPLLEQPLEGSVYVAQQGSNPFGSLLALYMAVEGSGVLVKLAGRVEADPFTGQLTTRFEETPRLPFPQVPFSDLRMRFFSGPRAALVTPQSCGAYTTTGLLTPWSSPMPTSVSSSFAVGSSCVSGFSPSLVAGTTDTQGGGFSPFTLTISRTDQDQNLGQISMRMPPGVLAMLSKVTPCAEPQAQLGECPAASQIGHVTALAGVGPDPLSVPQPGKPPALVFLTGPYRGAPRGLSIVVPAQAGPFDLGVVKERAAIYIDPHTAQATIVSDPLPRIVQGIPLDIRSVTAIVDREGFIFNPTNCERLSVTGTVASTLGASANLSVPFQAANCATLPFKPKFTVSTQRQTSKKDGASLDVKLTSGPGQANIAGTVVSLPRQLPSRLTTLQQACPEATFAANPAACPAGSNIGTAKAVTPVLNEPLAGPAYLVSHGGAAFPDLVIVLQGPEGVRLDLVGGTSIKKGITTSTFNSVPDAPVTSFEVKLPEGPHSVLTATLPAKARGSLCGQKLVMPTTLAGQNGARIQQSTKIAVSGCAAKARARGAARGRRARK